MYKCFRITYLTHYTFKKKLQGYKNEARHTLIQKTVCFIFEAKLSKPLRASGLHYCDLRSPNDGLWLLITWHKIIKQCQHAATAAAKRSCEKMNVDGCHCFLIKWKEVLGLFLFFILQISTYCSYQVNTKGCQSTFWVGDKEWRYLAVKDCFDKAHPSK